MTKLLRFLVLTLTLNGSLTLIANPSGAEKGISVSGYVKDAKTGEMLIGATVFVRELKVGIVTNQYGFYSLNIMQGSYTLDFSYVGYKTQTLTIELKEKKTLNIEMLEETQQLDEVVVKSDKPENKIKRAEMSISKIDMKTVKKIPTLMGEVDVVKAIQMLPGVQASSEGSSGFNVRGGGVDQNLIVLDEATVYNASHFIGLFSVFNNDAVKDVKLYKGDIPAAFGGRLSSLLDVRMKEGNMKYFTGAGGIGMLSSRLTLEGPIIQDEASYIFSARRTYFDQFFKLSSDPKINGTTLYFYDINLKLNYIINDKNRIFLSSYGGKDELGTDLAKFGYGNNTITFRWNHQYSGVLFSNLTAIVSNYNYKLGSPEGAFNSFIWVSGLNDYSLKMDYNYYPNPDNTIKFGASSTYHYFDPGFISGVGDTTKNIFNSYHMPKHHALEHAFYASNEQNVTENLTLKYGLRYTIFQNYGSDRVYNFDNNYKVIDSTDYSTGSLIHQYTHGLEPRLAANYRLNDVSSLKASYSRTFQYIQLASNSASGTPLDIWFPASPNVKPQQCDQYAVGYVRNLFDNKVEFSVELYYKDLKNVIDFRDNANLFLNEQLEGELRYGKGYSYGTELLLQLNDEKINGWISYTYARARRKINDVNYNFEYSPTFDRPHNVNIVLNYQISKRLSVSCNWVYITGTPLTYPEGKTEYQNAVIKRVSLRNAYRMPDYHRLDLSVNLKAKKHKWMFWDGEWNFSIYNVYNRHNPWAINFKPDEKNPNITKAYSTYLFPIIPGITYNFNF